MRSDFTAYVLAGGRSRRMGVNKLFMKIDGRTLLERTLATCEACFAQVKVVAGQSDRFPALDYSIVLDSQRARGPMAGVIAALEDCDSESCFLTAADLLDLSPEVIASLVDRYRGEEYLGLIEPGGLQPLCGIYHKSALGAFYQCARRGEFSIVAALSLLRHRGVDLPAGQWRNINSPDDLLPGGHDA